MTIWVPARAGLLTLGSLLPFLASCAADTVLEPGLAPAVASTASIEKIRCPTAVLSAEDPQLEEGFRLALSAACDILESDAFRRNVESSRLARKCPAFAFRKHKLLPGQDIYRILAAGMPESFRVTTRNLSGSTVAITTASNASMVVEPWKFINWTTGDNVQRASTVNTLVHEMTHLIRDEARNSYYQDGMQWTPWCDERKLVSYSLGEQAEAQWKGTHPQ